MKYWTKEFVNQIKNNNLSFVSNKNNKEDVVLKSSSANFDYQIAVNERTPLLQAHGGANFFNSDIVNVSLNEKPGPTKKQNNPKLPYYCSIS